MFALLLSEFFSEMLRVSRKAILREAETKRPWSMAAKVSSFTAVPAHRRLWGSHAVFGAALRGVSAWNSAIWKGLLGGSCFLSVFEGPSWFEWRGTLHTSSGMTFKEGWNPKPRPDWSMKMWTNLRQDLVTMWYTSYFFHHLKKLIFNSCEE